VSTSLLSLCLPAASLSSEAERQRLPLVEQLPAGRLIEIASHRAGAQMTTAVACLRWAQQKGETAAWVQPAGGSLFPPDLADSGIDLAALIVVHVPRPAGGNGLAKAAELLLRSGGFGMVVLDLSESALRTSSTALQGRLLGLAREHHSWLLLLSAAADGDTSHYSLGPLVSVCLEPRRKRIARGRFAVEAHVRKDKSSLLGSLTPTEHPGPWGLL
jgi:recombination protein RecA